MKASKDNNTKNLNKSDFINLIAEKCNIAKAEAERSIGYFMQGIEEVIAQGNKLTLVGFGSFYILENKARDGHNPKTREVIKIAASKTPKFKAGSDLKKLCNK
ncbi:MAG: HU family DNA-binding protein [Rickettsiales bacterium]